LSQLSDRNREKRRLVKSRISASPGQCRRLGRRQALFLALRLRSVPHHQAAYTDLKERRREQAPPPSACSSPRLFSDGEKTWTRKLAETLITIELEQKLTKEQIFEYYANQIPLGRRGSSISGFRRRRASLLREGPAPDRAARSAMLAA